MIVNALSVDVEEYYNGLEFETAIAQGKLCNFPSRVEMNVQRVLDLLADCELRATFFILGEVARAHAAMVRSIAEAGHEIACHGYRHRLVSGQSPQDFRADVRDGKTVLEELTGGAVSGYRAPNYSIGPCQAWAYEVLGEEGYRYDSSSYPIFHDRYGDPAAPRFPYRLPYNSHGSLIEFPVGTARLLGLNLPIGGGGYFRLFPWEWIQRGIRRVNFQEGKPVMFYFHPWELDPDQPRPPMPWYHRFRHYVNLDRVEDKLRSLFRHVPFAPARDVLEGY